MFTKLTDFKYKRTRKQAVGFYLAYILFAMLLGGLAGILSPDDSFEAGVRIGAAISVLFSFIICFMVVKEKKLMDKFLFLLLPFAAGFLAFFGGGLLGFIIPAILTTRKVKKA